MDLRLADHRFPGAVVETLAEVLASGRLTDGPRVAALETAVAATCGVAHGIATSSGTAALALALEALSIGSGDEVVIPDFTHPATAAVVLRRGASLRLVDVDPRTWNLAPAKLEPALSERTRLVIAVDVFGLPAAYEEIEPLLADRGVALLCDAAGSFGGRIGERKCGSFGAVSCLSFHPRKTLTTGEGGMVLTDDEQLAARCRSLRNHGVQRAGVTTTFAEVGFNYRLSELQAALGLAQLAGHERLLERRNELAEELEALCAELDVEVQHVPPGARSSRQAFVCLLPDGIDRDAVLVALRSEGIEATVGAYAVHAEPAFRAVLGPQPELAVSLRAAEQGVALPLHEHLTSSDLQRIAAAVERALPG
jgi:perosamine synthetase